MENKYVTLRYVGKTSEFETEGWNIYGFEGLENIEGHEFISNNYVQKVDGKTKITKVLVTPNNLIKINQLTEPKEVVDTIWFRDFKKEKEDPFSYEMIDSPELLPDREELGFKSRQVKKHIPATYKIVVSEEDREAKMNKLLEMLDSKEKDNLFNESFASPVSSKVQDESLVIKGSSNKIK